MKQSKTKQLEILRTFFEEEGEDYYKSVRVRYFYRKNYIEYEGNGDRNKTL